MLISPWPAYTDEKKMAFDEVIWAPQVNTYDIPGSTTLTGAVDPSTPTKIIVGDPSGFSAVPAIAQLNASSHINQLLGYYNRRAGNYNTTFGTSLPIMSYVTNSATLTKEMITVLNTLFTNIGTLLTAEGWQGVSLAWPISAPTTPRKFFGYHIAYLRKALAISGTLKPTQVRGAHQNAIVYNRVDQPYGTPVAGSETINSANAILVNQFNISSNIFYRYRSIVNFQIPSYALSGIATAALGIQWTTPSTQNPVWTCDIYSANANILNPSILPAYGGTFYTANNNFEGSFLPGSSAAQSVPVSVARIYPKAGDYLGYLLVGSREFSNTPCTNHEDLAHCNSSISNGLAILALTF